MSDDYYIEEDNGPAQRVKKQYIRDLMEAYRTESIQKDGKVYGSYKSLSHWEEIATWGMKEKLNPNFIIRAVFQHARRNELFASMFRGKYAQECYNEYIRQFDDFPIAHSECRSPYTMEIGMEAQMILTCICNNRLEYGNVEHDEAIEELVTTGNFTCSPATRFVICPRADSVIRKHFRALKRWIGENSLREIALAEHGVDMKFLQERHKQLVGADKAE